MAINDFDSENLTLTISAKFGTMSFASVSGSPSFLNQYLINSTYTPVKNWNSLYNGPDIINITVYDSNNFATGYIDIIANPVNDKPSAICPSELWLVEDEKYTFTNISVSDVDVEEAFLGVLETNISCQHGTFHATDTSGIWIKASIATETNRRIVLRGSAQSINSALSSLQYLPDLEYSGEDTLTLNVTDFGITGSQDSNVLSNSIFTSTIIAHIMAVNDKPSLSISKNVRHIYPLEDTKYLIQNAVSVDDFDLVSGEDEVEVLIEASMGNVSVNLTSYFVKAEGLTPNPFIWLALYTLLLNL